MKANKKFDTCREDDQEKMLPLKVVDDICVEYPVEEKLHPMIVVVFIEYKLFHDTYLCFPRCQHKLVHYSLLYPR